MIQKKIQYSHTDVAEEDSVFTYWCYKKKVQKLTQLEDVRERMKDEDYFRRSRGWFNRRQIEDVQEHTKDEDYKEDPEDDSVKDKQKMSKNIQKMKITEDVPAEIDDEDVKQCSKTSYDI